MTSALLLSMPCFFSDQTTNLRFSMTSWSWHCPAPFNMLKRLSRDIEAGCIQWTSGHVGVTFGIHSCQNAWSWTPQCSTRGLNLRRRLLSLEPYDWRGPFLLSIQFARSLKLWSSKFCVYRGSSSILDINLFHALHYAQPRSTRRLLL